jgi:hypothetical protein
MADLHHLIGSDLMLSATGDLLLVDGSEMGRQRVLRRLLSNAATDDAVGDLLFEPGYGAGLPRRIGTTNSANTIGAVVRRQLFSEGAVSQEPPPDVRIVPFFGGMSIHVTYADAETGDAMIAGFNVSR